MINLYGADAVRLFILSDSPPEKDVQWSDTGMLASYKFLQKLFLLNEKIKQVVKNPKTENSLDLSKFINRYLSKVEKNLSHFHYNVIIANIHEACSFFNQKLKKKENFINLVPEYSKFLISILPVVPHLSSECLEQLRIKNLTWPEIEEKFLIEETINIVVQINGKKRGIINVEKNISEESLVKQLLAGKTFEKFLKENTIKKQFYVKNRLINFLI